MTKRQRAVLIGLGAASAFVLIATLVLLGGRGEPTQVAAGSGGGTTSTSVPEPPPVTYELVPVTPGSPITTLPPTPPAPPTAPAPVPPPTTTTLPPVTGAGAVLEAPRSSTTRAMGAGCASLADPGWTSSSCGTARASGGDLAWVVSAAANNKGKRAQVWRRETAASEWVLALEARDDAGSRFASVAARVVDVSGDGKEDIAFGFRGTGNAAELSIDVVEGRGAGPQVTLHRAALRGSARVPSGQLELWAGTPQGSEPACCPSTYDHTTFKVVDGAWRAVARESVAASQVPPSHL